MTVRYRDFFYNWSTVIRKQHQLETPKMRVNTDAFKTACDWLRIPSRQLIGWEHHLANISFKPLLNDQFVIFWNNKDVITGLFVYLFTSISLHVNQIPIFPILRFSSCWDSCVEYWTDFHHSLGSLWTNIYIVRIPQQFKAFFLTSK